MKRFSFYLTIPAALCLLALPSQAGSFLDVLVTTGQRNVFEDQLRETIVDVNQNGTFDNGDVLFGFLRLDNRVDPVPPTADSIPGNGAYVIFSQEVANFTRTTIDLDGVSNDIERWDLVPTTVAGLTFNELTGLATPAGTVGQLYEDIGLDLITTSPGDLNGNGLLDMQDFFQHVVATGTALLSVGEAGAVSEFQQGSNFIETASNPNRSLAVLDGIPLGTPLGPSFDIGTSILQNFTGLEFLDVLTLPQRTAGLPIPTLNEAGVVGGETTGASTVNYVDAGLGGTQTNVFSNRIVTDILNPGNGNVLTSADFYPAAGNADVVVAAVPEPTSLSIFALMAGGLAVRRRRRRK